MEESWFGVVKVTVMLDCLHAYRTVVCFCIMPMIQLLFFLEAPSLRSIRIYFQKNCNKA